jgi:DnaK suppressor protein
VEATAPRAANAATVGAEFTPRQESLAMPVHVRDSVFVDSVPIPRPSSATIARLRRLLEQQHRDRRLQLYALDDGPAPTDPVLAAHRDAVATILTHIEAALARMDAGDYGTCVHCRAPIPVERLELAPHTPGCLTCVAHLARR